MYARHNSNLIQKARLAITTRFSPQAHLEHLFKCQELQHALGNSGMKSKATLEYETRPVSSTAYVRVVHVFLSTIPLYGPRALLNCTL